MTKIKTIRRDIIRQSPNILTTFGVIGVISTAVLAARATPTAVYLIEENELEDFLDKVKLTWHLYIPTFFSGVLTIASIIGANSILLKRNAALMALYSMTEGALNEYQQKVIEVIGEKKEAKLRDEIVQDKLDKNPIEAKEVIFIGEGKHLFFDSLSSRYFYSDIEKVRRIINDFNEELYSDMCKTVNDLYDMLGLEQTELGRRMGWDVENGQLRVHFNSKLATNNVPCIVLEFSEPKIL